jgi:hypothetical protein
MQQLSKLNIDQKYMYELQKKKVSFWQTCKGIMHPLYSLLYVTNRQL